MGRREARGRLFVISAPSGCGKTTLCKKLLKNDLDLSHSVSATTRPPRPSEKKGVDYLFVTKETFREMAKKGEFLEYEENFGYLYGTPRRGIESYLKKGRALLLSIDVKGAMRVRKAYPEESVLVFLLPPSLEALKRRLLSRMSEDKSTISKRFKLAKKEMSYKDEYDYVIVNDRIDKAYRRLRAIINAELIRI